MDARRLDLTVWRRDPMRIVLAVEGVDMGNVPTMSFAVRLYPDTPGEPLLLLVNKVTKGENGIRVVTIAEDTPGIKTTLVEIYCDKATLAPQIPAAGEVGCDVTLAYDFQWTLPDDGTGFTPVEETVLFGSFIVKGSVND